jgi:hypothetical protein
MNPFDFLNTINQTKQNLMEEDPAVERQYPPFMINRGLSYFNDTVAIANEMNRFHHLDNKLQYEFFLNIVRSRKRFSKWFKKEEDGDVEAVKEYYGYSNRQAIQALSVLSSEQIKIIKNRLEKGG